MLDYFKHLYEGVLTGIIGRWDAIYPLLARAVMVLLVALLFWIVFRRLMNRMRKRSEQNEFIRVHGQILT